MNYSFCVNGAKNKEYQISFRKIESNAKYRKSLLLDNENTRNKCISQEDFIKLAALSKAMLDQKVVATI